MEQQLETLTIERMSYSEDGIAHLSNGKACFITGVVPGDVVEARIVKEEKKFVGAELLSIKEASPYRIQPQASLETCITACPWAQISYEKQLAYKRENVVSNLIRIAGFEPEEAEKLVQQTRPSKTIWEYRNKIELGMDRLANGKVKVGMRMPQSHTIVSLNSCELLAKPFQKLPKQIAGALSYVANSHGLTFDRIGIRVSKRTKNVEIALWGQPGPFPRAHVAKVLGDAAKTTSIVRVLTKGSIKARKVVGVEKLSGAGSWSEQIDGETMQLSAPSFFQVNTPGAETLIELVMEALQPQEDDIAMDLYCGAGTFTIPLAKKTSFVQAVEAYGPAVRDLRRNLEKLNLTNVDCVGGDTGREFPEEPADIIIVDPPRQGLANKVVKLLSQQPARAIAYVSCDPATLARDLKRFRELRVFEPKWIAPVDLFPNTYHVENVTLLASK